MPPDFFSEMPEARARRKGGVGGIPPCPSVPPEQSGGGSFVAHCFGIQLTALDRVATLKLN